MLLNLMASHELKDAIELLRIKMLLSASENGFSNKRTIEISQSLDKYLSRYREITVINKT